MVQSSQGDGRARRWVPSIAGRQPLFTDFTYDNLGIAKNPDNPATKADATYVDPGLGGYLKGTGVEAAVYEPQLGKFKVPTLRNVDLRPAPGFVKTYGHNGYFKSLEEIVHFYNTRDVLPSVCDSIGNPQPGVNCWPAPEMAANINRTELGNLGLTAAEEAKIVAFLKTLSDGYKP
jgi:cytochrome c peroxidase